MVRITEVYVERLKSYGDFSNRRVGLRAVLDENDDVKDVYKRLAEECETLLELQEINVKKELVEKEKELYQRRLDELRKLKEEYFVIREELSKELDKLNETLAKIEELAQERQLKLSEKIIEKLRAIRRAIGYYDP